MKTSVNNDLDFIDDLVDAMDTMINNIANDKKIISKALNLKSSKKKFHGISVDGLYKDVYYTFIYPDGGVGEKLLEQLYSHLARSRAYTEIIYIVCRKSLIEFITDYHKIGKITFRFIYLEDLS